MRWEYKRMVVISCFSMQHRYNSSLKEKKALWRSWSEGDALYCTAMQGIKAQISILVFHAPDQKICKITLDDTLSLEEGNVDVIFCQKILDWKAVLWKQDLSLSATRLKCVTGPGSRKRKDSTSCKTEAINRRTRQYLKGCGDKEEQKTNIKKITRLSCRALVNTQNLEKFLTIIFHI